MTMANNKCEICDLHEPIGVASSALGPYSRAICVLCARMQAEDEHMAAFFVWNSGGDDKIAAWIKDNVKVFKDNDYLPWREWYEKHGKNIDFKKMDEEFNKSFDEKFGV